MTYHSFNQSQAGGSMFKMCHINNQSLVYKKFEMSGGSLCNLLKKIFAATN